MKVFSISDLHLSLSTPGKSMEIFGSQWKDHAEVIARRWRRQIESNDIVLVPGDISWAMRLEKALPDLEYLASLPGRKILLRGNHDFWWTSVSKIRACLDESISVIQNDALFIDGVAIGGSRLWTLAQLDFSRLERRQSSRQAVEEELAVPSPEGDEKLLGRELTRLAMSLGALAPDALLKIAMVHFPPIGPDLAPTEATRIIERSGVSHCVFGHLHDIAPVPGDELFGTRGGVAYHLVSCDHLDFAPCLIAEL